MANNRTSATAEGFAIADKTKSYAHPMTIDAGTVEAQVFRIEAFAEACEALIWNNTALNAGDSGAGPILELISLIRKELDVLGHRVST